MDDSEEVRTLRTIIKVQRAVNDAGPTGAALMKIVVEQACEATGAPGAVVELAEGDEMVYTVTAGSLRGTEGVRLSRKGSLTGECLRSGKVLISVDTETDDRVDRDACRRVGARSMVVVPLIDGNCVQGVLKIISGKVDAFSDSDVRLLQQLAQFIARALQRATSMEAKEREASIDFLTGLANRAAFLVALERIIAAAATSSDHSLGLVLFLDLDKFKPINDTHGHAVGDEVLQAVGKRISTTCRADDLGARIGGDEFAVLLAASAQPNPLGLRDRLLKDLNRPIETSAGPLTVGVSCGVAVVGGADLAEAVLARADAAMYADKRSRV